MAPHCWVPQEQWPLPAPDAVGWLLPDNEPHPLMQLARAPAPHRNQTMPGPTAALSPEAASASASAAAPEMSAENPGTSVGGAGKYEGKYEHLMWVNYNKDYVQLSWPEKQDRVTSVSFRNMQLAQAKLIGESVIEALDRGMSLEYARQFKIELVRQATIASRTSCARRIATA